MNILMKSNSKQIFLMIVILFGVYHVIFNDPTDTSEDPNGSSSPTSYNIYTDLDSISASVATITVTAPSNTDVLTPGSDYSIQWTTSGGTIPILLDEVKRSGELTKGKIILFAAVGSGWTWGASLIKWH